MLTAEERQRIEEEERKRVAEEKYRAEVRTELNGHTLGRQEADPDLEDRYRLHLRSGRNTRRD
jgi:hypothetical protein